MEGIVVTLFYVNQFHTQRLKSPYKGSFIDHLVSAALDVEFEISSPDYFLLFYSFN